MILRGAGTAGRGCPGPRGGEGRGRMANAMAIMGIDLGTTNSLASRLDGAEPRLIPNALGEFLTPSVVGIGLDGRVVVGREARELMVVHPDRCAARFKRQMGTDWTTELGGRTFRPEELSALILLALRRDAESLLGETVERAVITVPAYFNDDQRQATIAAGKIAGLRVERILNEPTAAALAYGFRQPKLERTLLVFDLGGGTFDVSIVEVADGTIEVRASSGEGFLGGEDFTRTMAARLLERSGLGFEPTEMRSPLLVARLLQLCERAKQGLTRGDSVVVPIPDKAGVVGDSAPREVVTRAEFDRWTADLLARVDPPTRRSLVDAGLKRSAIDEVILVGGATRMPSVVDRVADLFGKPPLVGINPDEVVALGAAVQAGLIARDAAVDDLVVTDVAPLTLGVEVSKTMGLEQRGGYYLPIIERNTTIPISRVRTVATLRPNQTAIDIRIFQGESRRIAENLALGEFVVGSIPRGPAGQEVAIRFTYDLNGVLEVEATVNATGQKFTHIVSKQARGLSSAQIQAAVQAMQGLKADPRDQAENRVLLRRAERLFGEIQAEARRQLDGLLDGFEQALDLGETETIDRFRAALGDYLDELDGGFGGSADDEGRPDAW